ncbi:MAG: SNF2-related protein [Byssovorax sp.]
MLAATLGAYQTTRESATLLGGDVAAVREVLAQLYEQNKVRKTLTTTKPERWGHDVPPWKEEWAVHRDGDRIYGDTSFLTAARQLPRFSVRHLGFGEFTLDTPQGEVSFNRSAGVDFPGQTGRSHLLEGTPEALALLLQEMHVDERLAAEATSARDVAEKVTARTLGAASAEAPTGAVRSTQRPAVDSIAALKRIPPGTKLRLVRSLRGPENSGRIFHQARSAEVVFLVDDPTIKTHGVLSSLRLKGSTIEPRSNGFAVLDDGVLMAEYVFADVARSTDEVQAATPAEGQDRSAAERVARRGSPTAAVRPAPKGVEPSDPEEPPAPSLVEALSPVEHRTAAARRDANLKAMWLAADLEAHPRPLTDADRLTLAAYSDWGGIGIQKAQDKFPPGFPVPEPRQLIHAYFTPPAVCAEIARVVRPLLADLVGRDGRVHALEPAVGIGRFPLALSGAGFETVTWHCVEFSELSYKMLRALRPDMDLYQGPFEGWVATHGADFTGRLKLVISNPPYGQRSYATTDDPDRSYRYKRADHYFLRRGLDLLGAGGLGIYIVPSGFLTGTTAEAVKLRAEVLRRHHLSAAFRLPNEVFSLANVVTDILFFRARGGLLAEVDEADKFILEGRYYEQVPAHILGTVVPNEPGKPGWHTSAEGYTVTGEFTALPPVLDERPMCASCSHMADPEPTAPPPVARGTTTAAEQVVDDDERMATVSSLGRRVESFLASVANPDLEPVGWEELRDDLARWAAVHGSPAQDPAVLALAKAERGPLGKGPPGGAGWLLKAFLGKSSTLIPSLAEEPRWTPRFLGNPRDPLQVGEHLYRSHKSLTLDELPGKDPSALFAAGWCEDSPALAWTKRLDVRGHLLPPDEYLFGELWPRFDRAQARAALGDAQAAAQAARLLEIIKPATFDEIEVTPQDGFVPIELLAAWLTTMNYRDPVQLVRDKGLVRVADVAYEDHDRSLSSLSTDALLILGWVNHDYVVFRPSVGEDQKVDDVRLSLAKDWTQRFRAWLDSDLERQRSIEHHYQRARQGYRAHGYGAEPLKLARWNPAVVLNPHQTAGARRLDANRGGGLGFDVGVGKTFTILASLALARQSGRARRPVIVVPQPIAFQWVANLAKALPDFRVVVIGINKKTIAHGLRKGVETSETDSPEERSRKWARFQGGEFDVAILTYDALPRTQMDKESTLHFIEGVTAIEREVELRRRNAAKQRKGTLKKYEEDKEKLERKLEKAVAQEELRQRYPGAKRKGDPAQLRAQLAELNKKHLGSLTERQDAVLTEGVGAWLAEMLELPASWKHDPDIVWNTIGVDWMAFDEGHNGKNLHMPSSREGGSVPKFMGNEGEGSKRAWHWFFRCCDVQSRGGEVIVATATPASNSPVEFYNLVKLMDKEAWSRIGIHDPEAFIDRFCLLEPQEVLNAEMETETRLACVGFKNLDELRSVIFKFWEFKTAKQAKLKLPVAKVDRVFVNMDAAQESKYESYIAAIEQALSNPKEGSHAILGLLAKMAMVAMHSQLDEKFGWKDAGLVASPHSPKFDALAQKILAQRGCGHIVFADYIAAHAWIRDVLIEAGIPASRIGVLNAVVAPNAADRQRIARDFNGDAQAGIPSKYDVLISNAIGEEGVDLQDKTCAIHHLDIGWTPKKTEQRNGRGVRQGNTLANINIFYYIANRSQDGTRLDMVRGKQNWISSLLEGEDKDTNNPAAQSTLSRKELLVLISRDPEKTRLRLEAAEAEREEERKKKIAKSATDTLRAVANRFDRARTERDSTLAAEYLSVAKQKLASLAKVPPEVWPWAGWAMAAEQSPMLVPKEGGPVYEGLRVAMPRVLDHSVIEFAEFGRIDGTTLGTRVAGAAHWEEIGMDQVVQLHLEPQMRVAEGSGPSWPTDDQAGVDKAMQDKWLPRFRHGAGAAEAWKALGWKRAPDSFVEAQWSRWGDEVARAMALTGSWAANLQVPAIRGGRLVLGLTPPPSSVLPPTLAGWRRFLEMAPLSGEKFSVLEDAGLWWFGRRIPRNLLVVADDAPRSAAA